MINVMNESEISASGGITVVKFGATWCGPCKMMAPTLDKLVNEFPGVNFLSVDVDANSAIAKKYGVRSVPTLLFMKDGQEVQRVVGFSLIDPLRKALRDLATNYLKTEE